MVGAMAVAIVDGVGAMIDAMTDAAAEVERLSVVTILESVEVEIVHATDFDETHQETGSQNRTRDLPPPTATAARHR